MPCFKGLFLQCKIGSQKQGCSLLWVVLWSMELSPRQQNGTLLQQQCVFITWNPFEICSCFGDRDRDIRRYIVIKLIACCVLIGLGRPPEWIQVDRVSPSHLGPGQCGGGDSGRFTGLGFNIHVTNPNVSLKEAFVVPS